MQAGLSYVCYGCNQIMERAPRGECVYCGSERIVSVSSLMHEPPNAARAMHQLLRRDAAIMPVNGGRISLAERLR